MGLSNAGRAFTILGVAWLALRFVPTPLLPPPLVTSTLESVRVAASLTTGRFEISGLPVENDALGLHRLPLFDLASSRLRAEIDDVNYVLARHAQIASASVEAFPEEGVTGIRLPGSLVPFYDQEAERLAAARRNASERPWEALGMIARVVENRLSEPAEGFELEDSSRRQQLTRMLREIEDVLDDAEAQTETALATFRSDASDAARRAGGPFHRRGAARILEIVLASLLGAFLAETLRRTPPLVPPVLAIGFAPLLATSVILLLEGTPILAVDPIRGLTLVFLPLSFAIGLLCTELLAIVARIPKLLTAEGEAPVSRHERSRAFSPASPPAPRRVSHEPDAPSGNGEPAPSELELDDRAPSAWDGPPLEPSPRPAAEVPFFQKRKSSRTQDQ